MNHSKEMKIRKFTRLYVNGTNVLRGTCGLGHLLDKGYDEASTNGRFIE